MLTAFDLVDSESGVAIVFIKANFHGTEIDFLQGKRIATGVWGIGKGGLMTFCREKELSQGFRGLGRED